jgi:hypothetical protein
MLLRASLACSCVRDERTVNCRPASTNDRFQDAAQLAYDLGESIAAEPPVRRHRPVWCTTRPKADKPLSLRVFGCLPNTVGGAPMAGLRKASKEEIAGISRRRGCEPMRIWARRRSGSQYHGWEGTRGGGCKPWELLIRLIHARCGCGGWGYDSRGAAARHFGVQPLFCDQVDEADHGNWQPCGAADGRQEAIRTGG